MKLEGFWKKVALTCCALVALCGLQVSFAGGMAIASPLGNQTLADNYGNSGYGNYPNDRAAANKVKEDAKSAFDKVAGSGSANRIEGKAEKDYGRVQRNIGNTQNRAEGAAKQIQGNAKQGVGKAQNAVENATEGVQDAAGNAIDAVKDFFNK
ncbi:MAG: CsbD family protein [Oscillatoriophycideae cyanobacterium NC_groundwater_1537_Pr4_S-0.65um_50_18]|nr:CsbD family protein [Oscillatoriophycideae cyanobacterium NC_groundwater_1537_Pr4_S-0.65um_50_18]